jgi:hypothetical protein
MLYEKKIPFKFKGNRNYIHGTDMFDSILTNVRSYFNIYPDEIKGSFHRQLKSEGILRIYNNHENIETKVICANFSIIINRDIYQVIFTTCKTPVFSSYDYDENKIFDQINVHDKEAGMTLKSNYTYIEQIVAITKKLHLICYSSGSKNWLFTKIHIKDSIDPSIFPGRILLIKEEKNFHHRLTQNVILLDNKFIGRIWFSKSAPEEN